MGAANVVADGCVATPGMLTATTCVVPRSWWHSWRRPFNALQLDAAGEESLAGDFRTNARTITALLDMVSAESGCTACQICRIATLADLPALIRPQQAGA
jgi:hypothetical protein